MLSFVSVRGPWKLVWTGGEFAPGSTKSARLVELGDSV